MLRLGNDLNPECFAIYAKFAGASMMEFDDILENIRYFSSKFNVYMFEKCNIVVAFDIRDVFASAFPANLVDQMSSDLITKCSKYALMEKMGAAPEAAGNDKSFREVMDASDPEVVFFALRTCYMLCLSHRFCANDDYNDISDVIEADVDVIDRIAHVAWNKCREAIWANALKDFTDGWGTNVEPYSIAEGRKSYTPNDITRFKELFCATMSMLSRTGPMISRGHEVARRQLMKMFFETNDTVALYRLSDCDVFGFMKFYNHWSIMLCKDNTVYYQANNLESVLSSQTMKDVAFEILRKTKGASAPDHRKLMEAVMLSMGVLTSELEKDVYAFPLKEEDYARVVLVIALVTRSFDALLFPRLCELFVEKSKSCETNTWVSISRALDIVVLLKQTKTGGVQIDLNAAYSDQKVLLIDLVEMEKMKEKTKRRVFKNIVDGLNSVITRCACASLSLDIADVENIVTTQAPIKRIYDNDMLRGFYTSMLGTVTRDGVRLRKEALEGYARDETPPFDIFRYDYVPVSQSPPSGNPEPEATPPPPVPSGN